MLSLNPISSLWLSKRQAKARRMIRGSTVLDVGARSEKIRADAVSIDIDKRVRPDICASIESLPIRTRAFDYITLLEVIEHLNDPQLDKAMEECRRVGDLLIVSTPNCDSKVWDQIAWPLWSHTAGREWIGAHKQFFGKKSFEELLESKYGMKVLERNYSRWNLLVRAATNPRNLLEPTSI
ncbi:MAG: class I SAM-dependent methyltransferase [Thaumarchaeota archaeon]|nr:class I SAM-dependent methyltransferase [Nitrososphaerota archaeon]